MGLRDLRMLVISSRIHNNESLFGQILYNYEGRKKTIIPMIYVGYQISNSSKLIN